MEKIIFTIPKTKEELQEDRRIVTKSKNDDNIEFIKKYGYKSKTIEYAKTRKLFFGQYNLHTLYDILEKDKSYLEWLASNDIEYLTDDDKTNLKYLSNPKLIIKCKCGRRYYFERKHIHEKGKQHTTYVKDEMDY